MEQADDGQKNLTPEERNRNKRTGDIFVYFRKTENPALKCEELKVEEKYEASFKSKDKIFGRVTGKAGTIELGKKILSTEKGEEIVAVKKNAVIQAAFEHPKYETHLSKILPKAILPMREVEDFEIYNVDRKFFNGENAIRMVENLLGIDAGLHKINKYGWGDNNHATYNPTNRHNNSGQ